MLLCGRKQHQEQPWPIFWSRHKNARLVGSSLAHVNERRELCAEAVYGQARAEDDPAYRHLAIRSPVKLSGPWTSVISKWMSNDMLQPYAHWLLDALPRLASLREFPADVRILVPPHRLAYQVESLRLLGLLDRCRWTGEQHLLVEDYYFSSPTAMVVCYNPYAVEFLRSSFLPFARNAPPMPARFFVRRTSYGRNIANEEEVLAFFRDAGWSVVDTAQLSLTEQIRMFAEAEAVCAIHGSGLANAVWCGPGCKVVELFADSYLAGDQEWICQCVRAQYKFVIFPSDHKMNAIIDLARLKSELGGLGLM